MFERFRSFAFSVTGGAAALPGLWERVGDDFRGCLILVERTESGWQGRITYVPALMRQYGWKVGDLKWRNLQPAGAAMFTAEDLFIELDPDTNKVCKATYHAARLCFLASDAFAVVTSGRGGRNTRWRRSAHAKSATQTGSEA